MTIEIADWIDKTYLEEIKEQISPNLYYWLAFSSNLTETIVRTGSYFELSCEAQSFGEPLKEESAIFIQEGIDPRSALIRKVFLFADKNPIIFARVIIPQGTYQAYQQVFDTLGNRPIGNALLYTIAGVRRQDFTFKYLNHSAELFLDFPTAKSQLVKNSWARRSLFILPKGPLLITEAFLNHLPKHPDYPD